MNQREHLQRKGEVQGPSGEAPRKTGKQHDVTQEKEADQGMAVGKENEVEQRSTLHPNLTQNGSHKPDHPSKTENQEKDETKFQVKLKRVLQKTEAGFLLVNKTDQARVQFTSQPSVAQVAGDARR